MIRREEGVLKDLLTAAEIALVIGRMKKGAPLLMKPNSMAMISGGIALPTAAVLHRLS